MSLYQQLLFPLIRQVDAETAHDQTIRALAFAQKFGAGRAVLRQISGHVPNRPVEAFGLQFANELGVAAGFDKNAMVIDGLRCLGFGHVEVGTLTPKSQPGNPKPRVFRLPEDRAIINRMGFPNCGAADAKERLQRDLHGDRVVIGVSLGKQKETALENAARDYLEVMDEVFPFADYLAVNVSSPNTPGLRNLQGSNYLEQLIRAIMEGNLANAAKHQTEVRPILLKIAPDLEWEELDSILDVSEQQGVSGIIACNTTINRDGLRSSRQNEAGGLSGLPLSRRSSEIVNYIWQQYGDRLPTIGVGGIMEADDTRRMLDSGAKLVQIYTGLVYGGPGTAGRILRKLEDS